MRAARKGTGATPRRKFDETCTRHAVELKLHGDRTVIALAKERELTPQQLDEGRKFSLGRPRSQLSAALAAVGAFAYTGPSSRDAATTASITTRYNSVKVSAVGSGKVIAEIYDATPTASFTTTTPCFINASVR